MADEEAASLQAINDDAVTMLLSVLGEGATREHGTRLLQMSGGDLNLAISIFFDGNVAVAEPSSPQTPQTPGGGNEPRDPSVNGFAEEDSSIDLSRESSRSDLATVSSGNFVSSRVECADPSPVYTRPQTAVTRSTSLGSVLEHGGMSSLQIDDDDDAVLITHEDAKPSPGDVSRSNRRIRPGTAPASRAQGHDLRDLQSKKDALRCVLGQDVDNDVLEHLLRSNRFDVQQAIEDYFDVASGSSSGRATAQVYISPPDRSRNIHPHAHDSMQEGDERRAPGGGSDMDLMGGMGSNSNPHDAQAQAAKEGPRKPFEDLAQLIGNGVKASLLAPIMVSTEGDVSKALEIYLENVTSGKPLDSGADKCVSPEQYYLRPEKPVPVICNVYDLSWGQDKDGKKKKTNSGLTGMGLGIYHSGIEVFGREISFGYSDDGSTGVFEVPSKCAAGVMPNITFKEGVVMGLLNRSRFEVDHLLNRLVAKYRGDTYDLVRRNCNHFANELCVCLVGKKIPSYINRPANVGRVALNIFAVPAQAIGKIIDGVKGNKKRDQAAGVGVVVEAPSARFIAAGAREHYDVEDRSEEDGNSRKGRKGSEVSNGSRGERLAAES